MNSQAATAKSASSRFPRQTWPAHFERASYTNLQFQLKVNRYQEVNMPIRYALHPNKLTGNPDDYIAHLK